jgi:hypothetical protein
MASTPAMRDIPFQGFFLCEVAIVLTHPTSLL